MYKRAPLRVFKLDALKVAWGELAADPKSWPQEAFVCFGSPEIINLHFRAWIGWEGDDARVGASGEVIGGWGRVW